MRSSVASLLFGGLLLFGCATPTTPSNQTGSAGSSQQGTAGSSGSGTGNSSGTGNTTGSGTGNSSGTGNTTGAGTAGSTGSGTAGTGGPPCTPDPTNLVRAGGWICDLTAADMIQGSWYSYGDTANTPNSGCTPPTGNPCTSGSCCMMGATVVDTTYKAWGCGLGMELASSGGTNPTKTAYAGPAKCFNITMTGNSGGNPVRISFSQSATPAADAVSPYKEIPAFTNGWMGQVCFADVSCPSWAIPPMASPAKCTKTGTDGTPVDMQIQIPGGDRAGAFNVCLSKVEPVLSGSTGTGGSGGGTSSCPTPSGQGSLTTQYADMHVGCPKDYIVQNNAWGSTAGQTINYGLGTKFKVAVQNENRTGNSTPASYPSIWTGAYNNRSTTGSGLPRAISQIAAGSVMTSFTWADNGATGSWNAAYDVWFSTGSGGDPTASAPSGGYLMVWFYDPPDNQPIGQTLSNGMGSATIGGKQFSVWYGQNGNKPVVSYVAQQNFNSWTFSLGDFIQDAIKRNCGSAMCLNSSWYLTNVFAGFEIWRGSVGLEVKDFGVTVP